jgi:hypothetical protein
MADQECGPAKFIPGEVFWRDHQPWLLDQGYTLRQRYHPDWKPSWEGTKKDPDDCEDSLFLWVSMRESPL